MGSDHPAARVRPEGREKLLGEAGFRRMLRGATWTLLVGLTVPLLVSLGLVEYMRRSARQVDQAHRVIFAVNHAEKLLVTMQSSFRGYRLLNDSTLLVSYHSARDKLGPRLKGLTALAADNSLQRVRADKFAQESGAWIRMVEESLARLAAGHAR